MADRMLELADQVEAGELNPKAAQAAASIRQWLASRYDSETFGDRARVDLRAQSMPQLHMEALQRYTDRQSG